MATSRPVLMGDTIFLSCMDDDCYGGFLHTEGFYDRRTSVVFPMDDSHLRAEFLFRIVPKLACDAARIYTDQKQKNGWSDHVQQLRQRALLERQRNQEVLAKFSPTLITFQTVGCFQFHHFFTLINVGENNPLLQPFQLQHVLTGRFLSLISTQVAERDRRSRLVSADSNYGTK
jgi:hypothetical protein